MVQNHQFKKFNVKDMPRISFEKSYMEDVSKVGRIINGMLPTHEEQDKPFILFFGEKNKLLIYEISADKWTLLHLEVHQNQDNEIEFNYFGSAVTLENGEVLITGGGISKKAFILNPREMNIKKVASMKLRKKEHSSICIKNKVYVIGGYDGDRSIFLAECEIYDVVKNEWTMAAPMKRAKCAFAATKVNEK
jgi:hypothetical protein